MLRLSICPEGEIIRELVYLDTAGEATGKPAVTREAQSTRAIHDI